ncbi:MAG: hypothetical protein JSV04_09360 [Candidatus Heimdallarchaeota archaeon]|nr:MAG: hypothetical protein JSV04_09360 [Candidatus Heimdallarchaeota archaeon]
MTTLTPFQKFELIAIPLVLMFSQIMIFLFGIAMIGNELWIIMGIPILLGIVISFFIVYLINKRFLVIEFSQLELLFRILVGGGGGALIPLLLAQILDLVAESIIFPILSLVFSLISGIMIISCLLFLYRYQSIQAPSE